MLALHFLLGLAIGLVALANAAPLSDDGVELLNIILPDRNMTTQGHDPSFDYFDYSTVQVWMGKKKVSVGTMTGPNLYRTVYSLLDKRCPPSKFNECHGVKSTTFKSRCMVNWPGGIEDCYTDIYAVQAQ